MDSTAMNRHALFTDVSLNPVKKRGLGAFLYIPAFVADRSPSVIDRTGLVQSIEYNQFRDTSSTRLELETVLWALKSCSRDMQPTTQITLYTDSQGIAGLIRRRDKLERNHFYSKQHKLLKNADLYRDFYRLYDTLSLEVIQVRGHTRRSSQTPIETIFSIVDRQVRKEFKRWMRSE